MNKKNIAKLTLFVMSLKNRFLEDSSLFQNINVTYKAGLKYFNGIGEFIDNKISYNFNGKTEIFDIDSLLNNIIKNCEKYESVSITYKERGTTVVITGDDKNVKLSNNVTEDNKESDTKVSHLLNRDYFIKVGKADNLLKEINIMTKDGKIKNDKIRKYNQIDHYVELLDGVLNSLKDNEITILDCGCGKSYLSFVLNYYLTEVKKKKCSFIGLDISEKVIESSKNIAKNLGYRNMEFHAIDIKNYKPNKKINMVISLHACDIATDMALALGIKLKSDCIIAVPCCHKELLSQYSYDPFKSIFKYGILKSRIADSLTDGMRGMFLESKGYDVSIVEYISPLETPKNLMIRAIKQNDSKENSKLMKEYINLMSNFNATPALYRFVNEVWSIE